MKYHLHTFMSCPLSQIVKIAIYEANIKCENTIYNKIGNPDDKILEICSRGDNPVLFIDNIAHVGLYAIRNSVDKIMINKFSQKDNPEIYRLLFLLESSFLIEVMRPLYYSKVLSEYRASTIDIQNGHKNLRTHLNHLNWLASHDYFLVGRSMSWVDIVASAFILCLDYINLIKWQEFSNLKMWYMKMKSRKSVISTIKSFKIVGYKSPSHYLDLDF